ncbi:MAG: AAA family ATPase [Oscillospiraceae bacterium]|nr:AAA family ATPase [Oscillospiraceae bacterium]
MKQDLKLISMSDVQSEEVKWLWYPYIPLGKVTIIQGDPGEGKTTFVLAMIALLTRGEPLPECDVAVEPMSAIYQTAEDGLADTIRPRLDSFGADCSRVLVIDESRKELTLSDERLEAAVLETGARLIVLDPLQAYLGSDVDMHRANEIRPIFKRLCATAERTGCAVILIGHMNKMQGQKASYRGLGSIDFRAAARSVLVVGRLRDEPHIRIVAHDKSSLAPEGASIAFELDPDTGFHWKGCCDTTVEQLLSGSGTVQTKTMLMEDDLREFLTKPTPAEEVQKRASELGVSQRTLMIAKKNLGVVSEKQGDRWYWRLPNQGCKDVTV